MGVVHRAFDTRIARDIALKVVQKRDLDPERRAEVLARFMGEARAAGRLLHPNIVSIFDFDENEDVAYIAMEFVDGTDLRSYLQERGALPLARIRTIVVQLLDALAYSHEQGVVHRDVKPANVFVLKNGNIKLGDFGIAKLASGPAGQTLGGTVLGTPSYMSPEHLGGDELDGRADLFSVGVMLYEMLTGTKPFTGDIPTILNQILNANPLPPSESNPVVPAGLDLVVAKAMAKRPKERYQTAAEFRAALEKSLTVDSPMPPRPPGQETPPRHSERTDTKVAVDPAVGAVTAPKLGLTRTFRVSARGDGEFQSVAEAVRQAQRHDHILIEPGEYEETLYIQRPLVIEGKGERSSVTLHSRTFQVIKIASDGVRIRNLSIRGRDRSGDRPAVLIRQGKSVLEECDISADSSLCVAVQGKSAFPHFKSCRIHDSRGIGIHFSQSAGGKVENCTIFGNPKAAIRAEPGSHPEISGGQIRGAIVAPSRPSVRRRGEGTRRGRPSLQGIWDDAPAQALRGLLHGAWIGALVGVLLLTAGVGMGASVAGLTAGLALGFWKQRLTGMVVGFVVALLFVPMEIPALVTDSLVRLLVSYGVPAARDLVDTLAVTLRGGLIGALTLALAGALAQLIRKPAA
jgi:serine/threonine protein kinase